MKLSLNSLRIIRYLADAGADINSKTKLRRTALNKACFLGRADVVAFLLSRPGIDIEWGDTKGRNPLHNAIFGPRGGREGKKVVPKKLDLPVAVGYSQHFKKQMSVFSCCVFNEYFIIFEGWNIRQGLSRSCIDAT